MTKTTKSGPIGPDGSQDIHLRYDELLVIYMALHYLIQHGLDTVPSKSRRTAADLVKMFSQMVEPSH